MSRWLLVALSLWGSTIIVPEFARVFGDYGTLGFVADNDGLITSVTGPPGTSAGLREGDCIDLKRTRLADRLAVFGGMGGLTYVRPEVAATLWVASGDCASDPKAATERVLVAEPKPIPPANRVVLFANQALGLFFIGLAAVLVWQRPSAMTWGFFLYAIWFNPGQFFVLYAELQRWPLALLVQECLQALAQAIGYAGFILFAIRFPHNEAARHWRRFERAVLPLVVLVTLGLTLMGFGAGLGIRSEKFSRWSYGAGYLVDLAVLLILRRRRKEQPPEDEQRTRWVHWGCRVGLAAFVFADSNMATAWWDPLWKPLCSSHGWLASSLCDGDALAETPLLSVFLLDALIALAVFHAVRRHRVINVSFAVSRGSTLLLTWVVIAAVFTGIGILVEDLLHSVQFLWYFGAILLMKIAFEWLHERLNEGCDRIFFRRLHAAAQRLKQAQSELDNATTYEAIDRHIIDEPAASLDLASAAVFRREANGTYRRHAPSVGWTQDCASVLSLEEDLEHGLNDGHAPGRVRELASQATMPTGAAQPVLAAPLMGATGVAAVALYGAHRTGDDLNDEEQVLLRDLSVAAGHAYSRAATLELREELRELKNRLEQSR